MIEFLILFFITTALAVLFAMQGVLVNDKNVGVKGDFKWNIWYFISFILIVLFLGTRIGVGRDFYSYKDLYEGQSFDFLFGYTIEYGAIFLIDCLNYFNLDFSWFILITSTITSFLLFASFKKSYNILPFGILFFFLGVNYVFVINGIRQGIAMMAFLNALIYVNNNDNKKLVNICWSLFYIFIGFLFHYSALLLIPILFIPRAFLKKLNSMSTFIILVSGMILFTVIIQEHAMTLGNLVPKYSGRIDEGVLNARFSLGAIIILVMKICPLFFFDIIKNKYPKSSIYFLIYAVGLALYYSFYNYMMINRLSHFFLSTEIFVYGYFCHYFISNTKYKYIHIRLYSMMFVVFIICLFVYQMPMFMSIQVLNDDYSIAGLTLSNSYATEVHR